MRRRITYANVAATLALVFSMSGGALAASHYLINSTKQINPKVLKKLKGNAGPAGPQGAPGKEGNPGKEGGAGKEGNRGPSNAFNTSTSTLFEFPTKANESVTVLSLSLPAGNFALMGKVLANNNSSAFAFTHCELLLGSTVIDPGEDGVGLGKNVEGDRAFLVVSGVGTLSSAGTATIVCKSASTEGNFIGRSLTAIQVASLG